MWSKKYMSQRDWKKFKEDIAADNMVGSDDLDLNANPMEDLLKNHELNNASEQQSVASDNKSEHNDQSDHSLGHYTYAELEEKLTLAEQKAHENWEKAVRLTAEIENERRRAEQKLSNALRFGSEKLAQDLIPVVDSLEYALQAADETTREGIALTMKMFIDVLAKHQVTQIDPVGELFNPQYHEAMSAQISADVAPNTILMVFQKGYQLNDRVIRPARVIVSKAS